MIQVISYNLKDVELKSAKTSAGNENFLLRDD